MIRLPAILLITILCLFTGNVTAQAVQEWGIEQLMHSLAQVKSAKGTFVERKYLAILNAPLEFSGTISYTAPDRLEKNILLPKPESLVLVQDHFTVESPSRKQSRTLALNDYPVVRAFVESIRSTLAGDLQTLTRFYQVSLAGKHGQWRLSLTPIDTVMQEAVRQIHISGSKNRISTIEIIETQGDRSVMVITEAAP